MDTSEPMLPWLDELVERGEITTTQANDWRILVAAEVVDEEYVRTAIAEPPPSKKKHADRVLAKLASQGVTMQDVTDEDLEAYLSRLAAGPFWSARDVAVIKSLTRADLHEAVARRVAQMVVQDEGKMPADIKHHLVRSVESELATASALRIDKRHVSRPRRIMQGRRRGTTKPGARRSSRPVAASGSPGRESGGDDPPGEPPPPLGGSLLFDRFRQATRWMPPAWQSTLFGLLPKRQQARMWADLAAHVEASLDRRWDQ